MNPSRENVEGAFATFASQFGKDLAASILERTCGARDTGTIPDEKLPLAYAVMCGEFAVLCSASRGKPVGRSGLERVQASLNRIAVSVYAR